MPAIVFQFTLSALAIVVAGILLVRSADRIAEKTGWGRIFVGSLLLAGATSLPELIVDLHAVWLSKPDLAVGDLLGSSLFNLMILAAVDTAFRHPRRAFSNEYAHHAQASVLSIHLTALVGVALLFDMDLAIAGVGLFTWIIAAVYLIGVRLNYEHSHIASISSSRGVAREWAVFGAACGAILVAAPYLVAAADGLAETTGLGRTFVGTTFVALSTSLPELVATVAAFRMGKPDLALGNVFGSNTFNMAVLFPLDAFYRGDLLKEASATHALTAFGVIALSSIAVMGQVSRKREKQRLWEPSSELILILGSGLIFILHRASH